MISRPEVQFIAKRLAPEKRHTVFTVITALYCQADDFGYIDLDDPELFTDMCMLENETELFDLLDRLVARKLVDLAAPRFYKIVEWTEPYETIPAPPSAQASLRRRREQIAERIARAQASSCGPEPEAPRNQLPAPEEAPARETTSSDSATTTTASLAAAAISAGAPDEEDSGAQLSENSSENDKNDKNVTLDFSVDKSTKNADLSIRTEREIDRERERYKDIHTHKKKEPHRKKQTRRAAPDGHKTDKPPTEQGCTGESATTGQAENTAEPGRMTPTGQKAGTKQRWPTDEKSRDLPTELQDRTTETAATEQDDDEVLTKGYAYIPENAPPAGSWIGPYEALQKCFSREWPMGFPNEKREKEALTVLSARISLLGSKKYDAEVVACQFVGSFANMIRGGGYYAGMSLLPSMLLKPGNYAKVFEKVQKILFTRQDYSSTWSDSFEKAKEEAEKDAEIHDPAESTRVLYAKYGISEDDPARFQKLHAAKQKEPVS